MKLPHLLFILLIDLIWASNIVTIKLAIDETGPLTAVLMRYLFVFVLTLPWLRIVKGRMNEIFVAGVVAGAMFMGIGGVGFAVTDNVAALAIVSQLGVPFSLVLAVIFLKETIRWIRIAGTALAFLGIVIMGFDPALLNEWLGITLTIVASFIWAVGSLLFRRMQGINPLTIHAWLAFVSLPVLFCVALVFEPEQLAGIGQVRPDFWGWIAFSAIAASIVGHAGMSWLLQKYPVSVVVPLTLPTPLISAAIATFVFGTPVSGAFIFGALVTFASVAVITWRSASKQDDASLVREWAREMKR